MGFLENVDRASEIARDLDELKEEIRRTVLRHDLIDDWLDERNAEMEYLRTVTVQHWYEDGPEALHLPHHDREANRHSMFEELAALKSCFEALDNGEDDFAAEIALSYVKKLRVNLRAWVEDARS